MLIALRESAVAITSVSVAKPTLDEVFLTLTGHDAEPESESDEYEEEPVLEVAR